MPALEAEGVTIQFGGLVAVRNVSLTLDDGAILGLIGPNGAGKSTLFNGITGFEKLNEERAAQGLPLFELGDECSQRA